MAGEKTQPRAKLRLYFFAAVLLLWLGAIGARLCYLQVVKYGEFTERAQRQQQRTIEVSPRRGIIYDRHGNELAMSVTVDSIFAVPSEVPDHVTASILLAKVLRTDPREVATRLAASRSFAWIARKVDAETSQRIRAMNLKGVYFQKESRRYYPKRELAAQVLGYVGMDDEGLGGIERQFDAQLGGHPGAMLISVDARRKWFGRVERQPQPGENVVLTLDEKIQYIVERELDAAMAATSAEAATVVVQNPRTGEILALANRPTFNPNTFRGATPAMLKNRAVSDIYEPGSTLKIVTVSAALEEKLTTPDEIIDCQNGAIYIGNFRIRDHKKFGLLTTAQVLAKSSGVGTIKLGMRLGDQRLDKYLRGFGFGSLTGVEMPGETRGFHKPASRWSKVSIGAISIGQEIGVSPLQLVSMVSTIANDGVYSPPRIVAGTLPAEAPAGAAGMQTVVFHPEPQHRAVSTMTAALMKQMMEGVVLFGTGRRAILDGYSSAGKTGTAQKFDRATGTYSRTKYIASFGGFAPVRDPAVTILVIVDSPVGHHEGGSVAAPIFQRIAQQVLAYMHVPNDVEPRNPQRQLLRASAKEEDIAESSEWLGADLADAGTQPLTPEPDAPATVVASLGQAGNAGLRTASLAAESPTSSVIRQSGNPAIRQSELVRRFDDPSLGINPAIRQSGNSAIARSADSSQPLPTTGTVIVDVEGGVVVPSLIGKPLRSAIELAQQSGIELNAVGTGIAREQSPAPGTRIPAGSRVAVRFAR